MILLPLEKLRVPDLKVSEYGSKIFFSLSIYATNFADGLPSNFVIMLSCSSSEPAGNNGFLMRSSARMHPTAHTSIAELYFFHDKMTSGALYQRVAI